MVKNNFIKFSVISVLFILVLSLTSGTVLAVSDSINVGAEVTGAYCNGNLICEPVLGETPAGCPSDCGCNNDGICQRERLEDENNCPSDCRIFPINVVSFLQAYSLSINKITSNSAEILWKTNRNALCKIFWGRTAEYKDGGIAEVGFSENHLITITGLRAQTKYHFRVNCTDKLGTVTETSDWEFTTLGLPDDIPPANVIDFVAIPGDEKIDLKWKNPPDSDFKGVRIVKNDKFYPSNVLDGEIIYEGSGTSFSDTDVENGKRYYYAIFSFDKNGNYSSGAIVSAVPQPAEGPIIVPPLGPDEVEPTEPPPAEVGKIKIEDFDFIIGDKKVSLKDGRIDGLKYDDFLTISIDYEKVPEVLKTIMVTLEKENKFFSFLLRINEDKSAYTATLVSPEETGVYPLTITILDYKNQALKRINGELMVEKSEARKTEGWTGFLKNDSVYLKIILVLTMIISFALIFFTVTGAIEEILKIKKPKYGREHK
jgi:hypothetical protein